MNSPMPRPRRLRQSPAMRRLVRSVVIAPNHLVLPLFVHEDLDAPRPVASMPGVVQHSLSSLAGAVEQAREARLGAVMLFAIPSVRDEFGSQAFAPDGILNAAIRVAREAAAGELVIMSDVCLDEFTSHGHCGLLDEHGDVDNDASVDAYARMAVEHARSGADVVGLSGMMDGQVAAVRAALDEAGFTATAVLAYAAKYASAFYGPFREAVDSQLVGDRRTYQMDPARHSEAALEVGLDLAEGADMVMVKPGLPYLDILADVAASSDAPVASYHVSGEYSQIEAAAQQGWIDRRAAHLEAVTALRRAGADIVLTYAALDIAQWIRDDR